MGDVLDAITAGRGERRALINRLARVTSALLDRDVVWTTVCAVAADLAQQRRLTGRHVRQIAVSTAVRAWGADA